MIATLCKPLASIASPQIGYGLLTGTPILTMRGEVAVETLQQGESVITRSGMRKIAAITAILSENLSVVHVTQGVLGNGRPEIDLQVSPQQPILLRDWRAKTLFDRDTALVAAERLIDGSHIRHEILSKACLYTLQFDHPEIIYAGNLEVSCPALHRPQA